MGCASSLGRGPQGSGKPRIPFLTAFTINLSRFSVWVLRRDSILEHVWYKSEELIEAKGIKGLLTTPKLPFPLAKI